MKYPYVRIRFVELNREVRQEGDYVRRHSSGRERNHMDFGV
jgi:hypothetical protein